jgi:phage gp36-like protein
MSTMPVSYTSVARMLERFPEFGSVTTLTSAQLYGYAADAEALVNAKIARHYALPLAVTPPLLETVSTDIAIYYTLAKRLFTQERLNASPWPDRYKEALAILDQIATGQVTLVGTDGSLVAARTDVAEVWTTTQRFTPTFHEGPWTTQIQDADKIEHELDRRDPR